MNEIRLSSLLRWAGARSLGLPKRSYIIALFLILLPIILSCAKGVDPAEIKHVTVYGSISGRVFLQGTTQLLPKVIITVGDKSDTTSESGAYAIDSLPEGSYALTASREDYLPYEDSIEISGLVVNNIQLAIAIDHGTLRGRVTHPVYGNVVSAKVSVGDLFDYSETDSGSYSIPNVPVGPHVLTCTQDSSYHSYTDTIYILSSDNEYDISMTRTLNYPVRVSNDAYVEWCSNDVECAAEKHGGDRLLVAKHVYSQGSLVKNRIFIGFPPLPAYATVSDLESVTLRIKVETEGLATGSMWNPETLIIRRILSPWSEGTVDWNVDPLIDTSYVVASVRPPQSGVLEVDVLSVYQLGTEPSYGVRLALDSDDSQEPFIGSELTQFNSSEVRDSLSRPAVVFRFTH